jgi:ubiquinone/menaquinone biosynthesis C-methylase UbiE
VARYDEIGKGYNFYRKADHRLLKMLIELLGLPVGSVVADIGAGTGNYTNGLAEYGYKMKAIELSEEMRSQALFSENVEYIAGRLNLFRWLIIPWMAWCLPWRYIISLR